MTEQDAASGGCLLESTWNGTKPRPLGDSKLTRAWIEDGDEVIMTAVCGGKEGDNLVGFGELRGVMLPALA